MHLLVSNLLFDRLYGFRKSRSNSDFLVFQSESWLSSLSCFSENFVVALDMLKAFKSLT